jgi:prephenate dehydratase/chorismate mutase/prephenate dehydratase
MDLKTIREEINQVDYEIVKLLNRRLELALRTKKFKTQVVDKEREKEVVDQIQSIPLALVDKNFSRKLFENIIAECRGIQMEDRKLVGFQGEHGSNGEIAISRYASNFVGIPCPQFNDVVEGLNTGYLDYAMLPVENSVEGGVSEVNDILVRQDIHICGEIKQPLNYSLLTLPEGDYRGIKVVYSHPQVLAQCSGFIARNNLEARPYYNAAAAARMIAETKPRAAAAIASPLSATIHNLMVIKEGIEDDDANFTRFLLLARESGQNEFGELYAILKTFNDCEVNLTRLESRPSPIERGNFVFLLDFLGSSKNDAITNALKTVEKKAVMYKMLGCYKQATSVLTGK